MTCTERVEGGRCAQDPSYFRTDGRCTYHGKLFDNLCGNGSEPRAKVTKWESRTTRRKEMSE